MGFVGLNVVRQNHVFVVYSFDIGPLLLQTKYTVPPSCTAFQLRDYLAVEGSTQVCTLLSCNLE